MRKSKLQDRPKLTIRGVAAVFGIGKSTLYRRIKMGTFSLDGIPYIQRSSGRHTVKLYDMESVFERAYPGADRQAIQLLMYQFRQDAGGMKLR